MGAMPPPPTNSDPPAGGRPRTGQTPPNLAVRIPERRFKAASVPARTLHRSLSAAVNEYLAWYTHEDGATEPHRLDRGPDLDGIDADDTNKVRLFRVPPERHQCARDIAERADQTLSSLVNNFVAWLAHESDAQPLTRPPTVDKD